MRAARIHSYGGPETVVVEEAARPLAGPGQLVVRVAAAGVNPVDWKIREGYLRQTLLLSMPLTLGCDAAGLVEGIGAGVGKFALGDKVFGCPSLMRCGAFAEYVLFDETQVAMAPTSISLEDAGALPVAAITAWEGLFTHGELQAGQTVLILGGAGGVGSAAIQIARHHGITVYATASTRNQDLLRALGATPIDYSNQASADVVRDVDLIFDCVGAETGAAALPSLRRGGVYVTTTYGLPPAELLAAVEARPRGYGIHPSSERLAQIAALVDLGALRLAIDHVYSLDETVAALNASQGGRTRGKLLIRP